MKKEEPAKKIGPKTKPTGFVPSGARKVPSVKRVSEQTVKAWRVKIVYMQERGRWETLKSGEMVRYRPPASYDGMSAVKIDGEYTVEKAKSSIWQKLVDWCASRKINPEAYVRQCFACVPLKTPTAPEPRQLMGEVYLGRWKKNKDKRRMEIRIALEVQKATAKKHLTVRQLLYEQTAEFAQIGVLSEGASLGLSPLFCYCLAVKIGTKKLLRMARRYEGEAILQFEVSRALYRKLWAEFLPRGFAARSKDLYPVLLTRLWADRLTDVHSDDDDDVTK